MGHSQSDYQQQNTLGHVPVQNVYPQNITQQMPKITKVKIPRCENISQMSMSMSGSPRKEPALTTVKQVIDNQAASTPVKIQQPVTLLFSLAKSVTNNGNNELETRMDKIKISLIQLIDLFKEQKSEKMDTNEKKVELPVKSLDPFKIANNISSANNSLTSDDSNKISRHIDGIINSDILNSDIIDTTAPKDEHKNIEAKNLSPDASTDADYDEDND